MLPQCEADLKLFSAAVLDIPAGLSSDSLQLSRINLVTDHTNWHICRRRKFEGIRSFFPSTFSKKCDYLSF